MSYNPHYFIVIQGFLYHNIEFDMSFVIEGTVTISKRPNDQLHLSMA